MSTPPPMPHDLEAELVQWGKTTIDICRRHGLPTEEEQIMHFFRTALHPSRYQNPNYTHIKHLLVLRYDSLLNAQIKPNIMYVTSNSTTSVLAPSRAWVPSRSSDDPWAMPDRFISIG